MSEQFTPWSIVPYGDGDSLVIHEGEDRRVCFMATPGESPGEMARIEANARLISAAPEMYEALKALDAIFDLNPEEAADIADMLDINDHNHLREVCELVRDALSKASSPQAQEGKQGLSPASAEIAVAPQVVDPDGRCSDGGEG